MAPQWTHSVATRPARLPSGDGMKTIIEPFKIKMVEPSHIDYVVEAVIELFHSTRHTAGH